jgi:ABC-type transport system substrate-binding protein
MVKNPNYWRPNRPYLDAISFIVVKEPAAAAAMMKAGQADIWMQGTAQEGADLRDSGLPVLTGPNTISNIYGDSANPNSPFAKKAVREAIEYSMDRPAIAKALGFGFQTPINQMTPPGTAGYNPNYVGRPYDPVKAKLLLGGAGYPEGLKTKLTCLPTAVNLATVIQNYLAVIGINVTIDIADPGRYWGMIFNDGWQGLLLGVSALNPEYAVVFLDHFGPYPLVKFVSLGKTPEFLAEAQKVYSQPDVASMRKQTQKMVTQASEDAMAIPLTYQLMNTPTQKWVHTTFHTAIDWTGWYIFDDWMSKH